MLTPTVGMNKMVINGRQKLFVTNDASTILNEIEVFHPVAKLLIMNSQRQEAEVRFTCTSLVRLTLGIYTYFFFFLNSMVMLLTL